MYEFFKYLLLNIVSSTFIVSLLNILTKRVEKGRRKGFCFFLPFLISLTVMYKGIIVKEYIKAMFGKLADKLAGRR